MPMARSRNRAAGSRGRARCGDKALGIPFRAAEFGLVLVLAARDRQMDKQHRMIGRLDRLDETPDESTVDLLCASVCSVLKHADAVDDDVGVQAGDELHKLVGSER